MFMILQCNDSFAIITYKNLIIKIMITHFAIEVYTFPLKKDFSTGEHYH